MPSAWAACSRGWAKSSAAWAPPKGALGLALTGTAVGTLLSLSFSGRLLQRWPHRSALGVLLPLVPVFYGCARRWRRRLG